MSPWTPEREVALNRHKRFRFLRIIELVELGDSDLNIQFKEGRLGLRRSQFGVRWVVLPDRAFRRARDHKRCAE